MTKFYAVPQSALRDPADLPDEFWGPTIDWPPLDKGDGPNPQLAPSDAPLRIKSEDEIADDLAHLDYLNSQDRRPAPERGV